MKTKIKNKFTAILVAIAMLFAGFFTFGGMKTKTAKADSDTTYSGNSIDDIAADFMFQALNHFGVSEGCWILLDDQILNANGAWESLLTTIIYFMDLTPASDSDSDRLWAIAEAGINIVKYADGYVWDIANGNLVSLWNRAGDSTLEVPHVCGIGIWQLNAEAYGEFSSLQGLILETHSELMPIYVIEREEIAGDGGLALWVYDDAHGGGCWGSWEGRPEE